MSSGKYVIDGEMVNSALKGGPFLWKWGSQSVLTSVLRDAERLCGTNMGEQQVQKPLLQVNGQHVWHSSERPKAGELIYTWLWRLSLLGLWLHAHKAEGRPYRHLPAMLSLCCPSPRWTGVMPALAMTSPTMETEAPLPSQMGTPPQDRSKVVSKRRWGCWSCWETHELFLDCTFLSD